MKINLLLLVSLLWLGCQQKVETVIPPWKSYDETAMIENNQDHDNRRMQYKLIQSKVQDKNDIWKVIQDQISDFSSEDYESLFPLVYEKDIPTIQSEISKGNLSYKLLTQWYLYRIAKYENDSLTTLHTILAVNPNAVNEAIKADKSRNQNQHPIFGMPILLKDNIDFAGLPTTAGAIALKANHPTKNAFIVDQMLTKGTIILGKVNLSEWAYFFCSGCPVGYSAIGGQTLNPYGRMIFETGGSSSGSGTSVSANYATAAIGTETSGSILSPSSKNSVVGLKPTVGLASRTGIVPISSTLDTPGPMTKSVIDNAIVLSAIIGIDQTDSYTTNSKQEYDYLNEIKDASLSGIRLGANSRFMEDSLYKLTIEKLKSGGAEIINFDPEEADLDGFLTLLNIDMKYDLPNYLKDKAGDSVRVASVNDVVLFNSKDTLLRAPYGQALFEGIVTDSTTLIELAEIKKNLKATGRKYFDTPMDELNLDAVLSINNYNAGQAAVAHYPCLTVPMGYDEDGEPKNITFIAKTFQEDKLLLIGAAFEKMNKSRIPPSAYSQ